MAEFDVDPEKPNEDMTAKFRKLNSILPLDRPMVDVSAGCSIAATPRIDGNQIFFGSCNSFLYCLNKLTGEKIWDFRTGGQIVFASPLINNNIVYNGSYDGYMYALNVATGDVIWKFRTNRELEVSPNTYNGRLYFGGLDDYFYCIDAQNGELIWKFFCTWGSITRPVFLNGCVLFASNDRYLYCLDAENGELKWKFYTNLRNNFTPAVIDRKGNLLANAIKTEPANTSDGSILVGSRTGEFYLLTLDGEKKWGFKTNDRISLSSPWAQNGKIYFTSADSNVYCLSLDGDLIWKYATGMGLVSTPVVHNDVLYIGSSDQNMYALNAETGQYQWAFHAGGLILSAAIAEKDRLYFGSWDGNMYCLDTKHKQMTWRFLTGGLKQSTMMGINFSNEAERIKFAIQSGMSRDLAYKTQSDEEHDRVGFNPYIGQDEKNLYVAAGLNKNNPYVGTRRDKRSN